ncbi:hypothetical protein D3C75_802030 [compost metagenome]
MIADHAFQPPIFHKGRFADICFIRLIGTADKTDAFGPVFNKEVDDLFADFCQIDIHRVVLGTGLIKINKADVVG